MRFNYDDNYFFHRFQGIPVDGYTALVSSILDHPLIEVQLETSYAPELAENADHVFWSGALDAYFSFSEGRLGYRTLDFETFRSIGDYQGCAVMNYSDADVPYTRITEHKHFAPWEEHEKTTCFREVSRAAGPEDIPYYPIRLVEDKSLLKTYLALARQTPGVTFIGRLGTYRYIDMDVSIREAMQVAECFIVSRRDGKPMAVFSADPL